MGVVNHERVRHTGLSGNQVMDVLLALSAYGILVYLDNCVYFSETGWPFTIPSNSDFPHAPWWTYSEQNNDDNGFHATAGLVGFILRSKWPIYAMRPSMYILSPTSFYYKGNEDIVEKELEFILESRNDAGVWDIQWKWGRLPERVRDSRTLVEGTLGYP